MPSWLITIGGLVVIAGIAAGIWLAVTATCSVIVGLRRPIRRWFEGEERSWVNESQLQSSNVLPAVIVTAFIVGSAMWWLSR